VTFDPNNLPFTQTIGSRYRKRVGRGGRVHLDRLSARSLPKGLSQQLDENILARLEERWRYDTDVGQDLPAAREPLIFDDFDTRTSSARLSFTSLVDWESLLPSTTHVDEALRWTAKEPESLPPIQVIGKLPGQRIQPFVTGQNGQIQNLLPPNMANQLYAAASRAMNVTQAQAQNVAAQQIRRASSTAPKSPIQGQMQQQQQPQQSGPLMNPPQPFPIRRLMMENSA
jgi:enhancer of polycomb-like protein